MWFDDKLLTDMPRMYQYVPDSPIRFFLVLHADCKLALVFQDYATRTRAPARALTHTNNYMRGLQELRGKVHVKRVL